MTDRDSGSTDSDAMGAIKGVATRSVARLVEPIASTIEGRWLWAASIAVLVIVVSSAYSIGGWNALREPAPYLAVGVLEVLVAVVDHRRSRLQPKVLLARFVTSSGDDHAADYLRRRVSRSIKDRTVAVPRGRVKVVLYERTIDVDDDDACDRFRQYAADSGFAAAVSATVSGSGEDLSGRWAVLPAPKRARRIGAIEKDLDMRTTTVPFDAGPDAIAEAAEIVIGVVLLECGKPRDSLDFFRHLRPTYVSRLFGAYSAWTQQRWSEAANLAQEALNLEVRPAAVAVATAAFFELDRQKEALGMLSIMERMNPADDVGLTIPKLSLLSLITHMQSLLNSHNRQMEKLWVGFESSVAELAAKHAWEDDIRGRLRAGDGAGAIALIEPRLPWVDAPQRHALYAEALIAAGRTTEAVAEILTAATLLADYPPDGSQDTNNPLDLRTISGRYAWQDLIAVSIQLRNDDLSAGLVEAGLPLLGHLLAMHPFALLEHRSLGRDTPKLLDQFPKTMALLDTAKRESKL